MIRTQIQLTEEQAARLKRIASARGISMAALIREAVDELASAPDPDARWTRALAAVGAFRGGEDNVSEEHDLHLAEALRD